MDTEKQRQHRRDDARLTESGHARSEQLNTRGPYRVTNQQSLACLSESERRRPGWFLDMKYQTCLLNSSLAILFSGRFLPANAWLFSCITLFLFHFLWLVSHYRVSVGSVEFLTL